MYEITKDFYEISVWEDVLVEAEEQQYELATQDTPENETFYEKNEKGLYIKLDKINSYEGDKYVRIPRQLSFFKEEKITTIGASNTRSPKLAYNTKFVDDVKGEHTLTFTMNGKYYDEEKQTFVDNPYLKYLTNERKIKLFFRDEWYDLLIKKVEENKKNYSYTYTASDLYINELGKNGFKVELNSELENNQGTAEELAAQILEDTDWRVSSYTGTDEKGEPVAYRSDLLVETNLDTLYQATLAKDVLVKVSADGWLPIRKEDVEPQFTPSVDDEKTVCIEKGSKVYLFYSDLVAKNLEPMILYRRPDEDGKPVYQTNDNEDIIINSYNFRVTRENEVMYNNDDIPLPNFINEESIELENRFRAYETVRRARTGYDPVTDEFITYFLKRLYVSDYVKTKDLLPYSNKEYFVEDNEKYKRFYGYVFEKGTTEEPTYYELQYKEFLSEDEELDENTQYYVKSKVPEYVPTLDKKRKKGKNYYSYDDDMNEYVPYNETELPHSVNGPFIYEQSGKMIDGYIKYEQSTWSKLKGYTKTEYLSPTLVQNFLSNSVDITTIDGGWLFDGSPSSNSRAGELVTRFDAATANPEESANPMLVLHLTDSEVYYASQTGNYLYTNYDFVEENPSLTKDVFDKQSFYVKEVYLGNDYTTTDAIDEYYCVRMPNGSYQTITKIYYKDDKDKYHPVLRWNGNFVGNFYIRENGGFSGLADRYTEANRYVSGGTYYQKNGDKYEKVVINSKWEFLTYDKQLYFEAKQFNSKEYFYSMTNYEAETPIYKFTKANSEFDSSLTYYQEISQEKDYNKVFVSYNDFNFKGGFNDYFIYDQANEKYVKANTSEPIDGIVYYTFKPTGKMRYLPYDYYKNIWERAAIRDYMDSIFLEPDYQPYSPFTKVLIKDTEPNKTEYWRLRDDGSYEKITQLTEGNKENYPLEEVYERWPEDAIAEMKSIFQFEYTEDELTEYARDILNLVSELLEWVDYQNESKLDIFNAIDLFGIKRTKLLQKLKTLSKEYPDVEGYQKQELLKYLNMLNTGLNQDLRIEMSAMSDPKIVNYKPTADSERVEGKNYYYFERQNDSGEVSTLFLPVKYTGNSFYQYNGYRTRIEVTNDSNLDPSELIIYEFSGELIDLISDLEEVISTIEEAEQENTLISVKKELEKMYLGSFATIFDPCAVYDAYQGLTELKKYYKDGKLEVDEEAEENVEEAEENVEEAKKKVEEAIEKFFKVFPIDDKGKLSGNIDFIAFYVQAIFNRTEINGTVEELLNAIVAYNDVVNEEAWKSIYNEIKNYADSNITYIKVDTENEEPNPNEKYYVRMEKYVLATGEKFVSGETYYKNTNANTKEVSSPIYREISKDEIQVGSDEIILTEDIYRYEKGNFSEIPYSVDEWEIDENTGLPRDYYIKERTLVDYSNSKNIDYNTQLRIALLNLEEIMALKFDDIDELSTGNKIFDEVVKSVTGFTIIWHLEKEEREQVVEGTKLLTNLAKQLMALQISEDFVNFSLSRRYEAHKRRALNTGFADNREIIKKLNKGEEYVFALSLGQYNEGEEPPVYNKQSSVTYGDVENKYYYFDNNPNGVGDYTLGIDDYTEIFKGEENYSTPYGWMEAEGNYELASIDETIAPLFYCIAQETTENRFVVRFVPQDSKEIEKVFYYPDDNGEFIYKRKPGGLFETSYSFVPFDDYNWLNGQLDQILLKDGSWTILTQRRSEKAKRYRKSPTYICMKPNESSNEEIRPLKVSYYTHENFDIEKAQVFRRSTEKVSEGKYKLDKISSIEGIESDNDFYKPITPDEMASEEKNTTYYTYNSANKVFEEYTGEFDNNETYYVLNYDRQHYSLYDSEDQYPDLYCFTSSADGDYVHIIRDEEKEQVAVKWYEFWKNPNNMNKTYREFKDSDELYTSTPHYFKRYNRAMDYDYHTTEWKDGHIGPWKEYYQRYTKQRVHLYNNTELNPEYTYWVSTPFSDGSECYTLYTAEEIKRFTLHKRYLGFKDGLHQFATEKDIRERINEGATVDVTNTNVSSVKFHAPANYKEGAVNLSSAYFELDVGIKLIPVKLTNRLFRPFENETDSQRVPYIMLKTDENFSPDAGEDWVYCESSDISNMGYYRPCTVDDANLYTNWSIKETIDEAFGLYKFLKVKDPTNWNSDTPPFNFATPIQTTLLAHNYAIRVIKSLNTPYWWGRIRTVPIGKQEIKANELPLLEKDLEDFWNWGVKVFPEQTWAFLTGAATAEDYVGKKKEITDWLDKKWEDTAAVIRKVIRLLDITSNDHVANRLLRRIDNAGIDILGDDPNYVKVNTDKEPDENTTYYTMEQIDNQLKYVVTQLKVGENGQLVFDEGKTYYVLAPDKNLEVELRQFKDPSGLLIGIVKKKGDNCLVYHYYPNEKNGYYIGVTRNNNVWTDEFGKELTEFEKELEESKKKIYKIDLDLNSTSYGTFVEEKGEIEDKTTYYYFEETFLSEIEEQTKKNRTNEARLYFWDAMYGLYGTQWSSIITRENFGMGCSAFLNTQDEFTNAVLKEIYAFSEIWVKETHNGLTTFVPFESTLHSAKTKFYRHTFAGNVSDVVDGITEIYYNDGGLYKYYANKEKDYTRLAINYQDLKASFCEYDYSGSEYKIEPTVLDNGALTEDYTNNHRPYLEFDCNNPIDGYFDLTISPQLEEVGEIIPAVKERYVWWKSPVLNNYNLTDDMYSRVGMLFYTDKKETISYPILQAQLFKYKTYKSNNYDVLIKFRKKFYEYELSSTESYKPNFKEYRELKEAFQGYFGIDEWNKVEEEMDLDYKGEQQDTSVYTSYLDMLNTYFSDNEERVEYLKERIIYDKDNKTFSLAFKEETPEPLEEESPVETQVNIILSYFEKGSEVKATNIEKHLNEYEKQEKEKDLKLTVYNYEGINKKVFENYIQKIAYKYCMRPVNIGEENPDPSDLYYCIRKKEDETYYLEAIEGIANFSEFDGAQLYLPRVLEKIEIEEEVGEDNVVNFTAKIKCLSSEETLINLNVSYQIIDGITQTLVYKPETYENVPMWPNINKAYLVKKIEELAAQKRNKMTLADRIANPNPFELYVCNDIESDILFADGLIPKRTYSVVVHLDSRILSGHHDISANEKPLSALSSLNETISEWWDDIVETQKVHYNKAQAGWNNFWSTAQKDASKLNLGQKVIDNIIAGFKNLLGKTVKQSYGRARALDIPTEANDKAVNESISELVINELQKEMAKNSETLQDQAALAIYIAQLSNYLNEVATFVLYIQQLGYYDFLNDENYFSDNSEFLNNFETEYSNNAFINRILSGIYQENINGKIIMALPGEIPDNNDLIMTNYFIYDPTLPEQDDIDTLVYDYVGNDALSIYIYDYDNLCQKVRAIEAKEKNYLSVLSSISERFECWIKYQMEHYTSEENEQLSVNSYGLAHTPGEVKMVERAIWVAEDDSTDIIFDPINITNFHISKLQDEAVSALSQFNPRTYWYDEVRNNFEKVDDIHSFKEGVEYYIVTPTGSFKLVDTEEQKIPDSQETYYVKKENADEELLEKYEEVADKTYLKNYIQVPLKTIYLKQFTGDLNYAGFRYGINLKSIKRTQDSKDLVSRLIVKENTNEQALDGFCTIQRASENPIKENFILNFDYYIQHGMINRQELLEELYGNEEKSGYYSQLATINKDLESLVDEIAEVNECLDRINANYETYALARDAAQDEIDDMANTLAGSLGENLPSPWKYNMAKETQVLRTSWSDTKTKQFTTKDEDGNIVEMTEHLVEGQTRTLEIPKFNEDTQSKLNQMDIFQYNYEKYRGLAEKARLQKENYEELLKQLYQKSDDMYQRKNNLNLLFFKKYYRFIQEGSWKDDKYMDDTLYYLDALAVARNSAFPKVTYDIQTIDLETLDDYKGYSFRIGDKTYIEDTEFFGYTQSGKPYQEETIITKLEYNLDDASKNKITVSNYKTQFEDLFKRIAAAVSKVELSTGGYNRANAAINETGLGAIAAGGISDGLESTNLDNPFSKIKIVNGSIYLSKDGGITYQEIIGQNGINPKAIGQGTLDLTSLVIGGQTLPEISLSKNGLTAFKKDENTIDYSTLVRFDSYGMYGIKNYKRNSSTDDASKATLNDVFVPVGIDSIYENASFGLTWNGFFLNTGDNSGRVTIGTNQDLRMSVKNSSDAWQDRIIIGKLCEEDREYYGFRIIDEKGNIVLNTDDRGELYLRHKLYISHFNNEFGTISNGNGDATIAKPLEQTNIALGIVKAYKRKKINKTVYEKDETVYEKGEDIYDNYSSLEYLTKILSVKSLVDGYDLKDTLKGSEELFKQFIDEDIKVLIDPNENLAIFDNGNLYAKNAWIEGHIRATDGEFTGTVHATDGEFGEKNSDHIKITGTSIQSSNGNWLLNYDGTASFKNVNVAGTISSAVFEYDKIQTLGGILLVRPSYEVLKEEEEEEKSGSKYLILSLPNDAFGFQEGDWISFSVNGDQNRTTMLKVENPIKKVSSLNPTALSEEKETEKTKYFKIKIKKPDWYDTMKNDADICTVTSLTNEEIGNFSLGLNSTPKPVNGIPPQSFSLIEAQEEEGELKQTPKIVLGNLQSINTAPQGYGLYADNVYLNGELTTESDTYSAGVSTRNKRKQDQKELVFWAGEKGKDYAFYVSEDGYLFAKNGEFQGTVISSKIKTSTIVGNATGEEGENKYGLTILPEELDKDINAILFTQDSTNSEKDYFRLSSSKMNLLIDSFFGSDDEPIAFVKRDYGVGLFFNKKDNNNKDVLTNYLLNITENSNQGISVKYLGKEILTLTEDGIDFQNLNGSNWGKHIDYKETTNGCDIYFI